MNELFQKLAPAPPIVEITKPLHPFYPLDLEISNYVANDRGVLNMLAIFLGGWVVILGATWVLVSYTSPKLRKKDKTVLMWFILTGSIHFFFEGYFAVNHTRMGSAQDLFGQLWKEYSLSDSRYLVSDPFVLCMETITAICWGPLSYVVAYTILKGHPLRYPMQTIVSLGQLYGDTLYYATSMFDLYYKGLEYCRPEPYYFWFYFFFMNFIWIVLPLYLLYDSVAHTVKAFKVLDRPSRSIPGNGSVKLPSSGGPSKKLQ